MQSYNTNFSEMISSSYSKRFRIPYTKIHHFRLFALLVLSFDYIIFAFTYQYEVPLMIMKFLTEWSYLLTFVYFLKSVVKRVDRKVTLTHSSLFHVCLSAEFLVVVFYWVVIFPMTEFENFFQLYVGYTRHILPFLFLVIDYAINNIKLDVCNFKYVISYMFAYMANNIAFKVIFDVSIYNVITWSGKIIRFYKPLVHFRCFYIIYNGLGSLHKFRKVQVWTSQKKLNKLDMFRHSF